MRVLVTGAAGFIGANVCRTLLDRGHEVLALVRPGTNMWRLTELIDRLTLINRDLLLDTQGELEACFDRVDICIHCAWHATPSQYLAAPENILCLEWSLKLFSALAAIACPRLVGVGTCAEYAPSDELLVESDPLEPHSLYAAAKASTFFMGSQIARLKGMSFAWGRIFHLYGPGEDQRRFVPQVALQLLRGLPVDTTHGDQLRDFLHVEDVASGLVELAFSGLEGAVNISSGHPVTVGAVVSMIENLTGRHDLVRRGARPESLGDLRFLCGCNHRLTEATAWHPAIDLAGGLDQTVQWWRSRS